MAEAMGQNVITLLRGKDLRAARRLVVDAATGPAPPDFGGWIIHCAMHAPDQFERLAALVAPYADVDSEAVFRTAVAHLDAGHPLEAGIVLDCLRRSGVETAALLKNLAVAQFAYGDRENALATFDRAAEERPEDPEIRWNKGLCLLSLGRWAEGFPLYRARWDIPNFVRKNGPLRQPAWRGEAPQGRRLLLYAEQGFGDSIQFSRFASLLRARGAEVVLEAQPPLQRLLAGLDPAVEIVVPGSQIDCDGAVPLLDVPGYLGTDPGSVPAASGYLSADGPGPAPRDGRRLRVGLVFQGNLLHRGDRLRSIPPSLLAPLFAIETVDFVNLQLGPGRNALLAQDFARDIEDPTSGIGDFADTARIMWSLDAVVTVDTAAAHLAGALGVPTLLMLPRASDWRWLTGRSDSPWYESVRLIRQTWFKNWGPVVETVTSMLAAKDLPPDFRRN